MEEVIERVEELGIYKGGVGRLKGHAKEAETRQSVGTMKRVSCFFSEVVSL